MIVHSYLEQLFSNMNIFFLNIPQGFSAWFCPPVHAVYHSLCHLKAASGMRVHISHSSHRLDLGVMGAPFIPVFVGSEFKQVLISTVAWILISNPPKVGMSIEYIN